MTNYSPIAPSIRFGGLPVWSHFSTLCQHYHHFRNFRMQACLTFNVFKMNPLLELLLLNFIIIFFCSLVNSLPAVSSAFQSLRLSIFSIKMMSRMTQHTSHRWNYVTIDISRLDMRLSSNFYLFYLRCASRLSGIVIALWHTFGHMLYSAPISVLLHSNWFSILTQSHLSVQVATILPKI